MNRLRIITESPETGACGSGSCGCGDSAAAPEALELATVQERLGAGGPRFWKSFEELAETAEFQDLVEREFPRHAFDLPTDGVSRRQFLHLSGASLALAGLTSCTRQPVEPIVPYVNLPEGVVPGQELYFATAFPLGGYGTGVLAKSHMGRPIKVEGNPDHPSSRGGTDLFAQASVLGLYDPDRSQNVIHDTRLSTWEAFTQAVGPQVTALAALGGDGLAVLTGNVTSPTLAGQLRALRAAMPKARWYQYEAAGRHNAFRGAVAAFGAPAEVHYDLAKADVIVSLDSDFLTQGPGAARYARDFAERRRIHGHDQPDLSRFYIVETTPSLTGTVADHRLALAPSEISRFALALAGALGVSAAGATGAAADGEAARWVPAVSADLRAAGARALVVAGDSQPPAVHVLAHAMNQALGAVGSTVHVTEPVAADPVDQPASIEAFARDFASFQLVLILGTNPLFDAPAGLDLAAKFKSSRALRVHLGLYDDETAEYCQWHVPEAHYLESWGDVRGHDGTATIQQPLIDPLFGGKTASEVLALCGERTDATAYQLVQATWGERFDASAWAKVLNDGVVPDTAAPALAPALAAGAVAGVAQAAAEIAALPTAGTEIVFRPDPSIWDGRFANNSWLQECPKPITSLTWDNAVLMSPRMADTLGVEYESSDVDPSRPMIDVTVGGETVALPAWIVPGHADGAVTVHFGYGRRRAGNVGNGVGVNVGTLRSAATAWTAPVSLALGEGDYLLAAVQHHHSMYGRHLLRVGTVDEFKANPHFVHEMGAHVPDATFYPRFEYPGHAWGMAVDLAACTGCNACVIACQSENNIPTVGKQQVLNGREMHWLRIDRYYEGEDAHAVGSLHNQPVLCQQCEVAPCEPVCPVAATVHSDEGLNDMVYNRCVGTRYCSNNCPYKVRRFNFLKYTDHTNELLKMVKNPEVTVRMRGVMEKCTYCVQRISAGRIRSGVAAARSGGSDRVPDGTIKTACQQACPSGALVFGDINDPASEVAQRKALPLNYQLLEELGTRPRTTYLAKLRNPNPALEAARA